MSCYFCHQPLNGGKIEDHHPDRENMPDFTVRCHDECHRAHHQENGDFVVWGALSSGAGRKGYRAVIQACPEFHRAGGLARAAVAVRDDFGRFLPRNGA